MCLLAVNRAGAAFLPIDPDLPPERVGYMLQDAAPALVLYGDATEWIAELAPDGARSASPTGRTAAAPARPAANRPCTPRPRRT